MIDSFVFLEGKESTESVKGAGEATGTGQRQHC